MKSLIKFSLLFALIIAGKLTKQTEPAVMAAKPITTARPDSIILVNHLVKVPATAPARPAVAEPERSFLASF